MVVPTFYAQVFMHVCSLLMVYYLFIHLFISSIVDDTPSNADWHHCFR